MIENKEHRVIVESVASTAVKVLNLSKRAQKTGLDAAHHELRAIGRRLEDLADAENRKTGKAAEGVEVIPMVSRGPGDGPMLVRRSVDGVDWVEVSEPVPAGLKMKGSTSG